MDPLVELLLKNGVFGILAGVGFYLYFKERKLNQGYAKTYLDHQVEDTKAKTLLTTALEDLAVTIETLGNNAQLSISGCRANVDGMMKRVEQHLEDQRVERAREEGRREATNPRIRVPGWRGDNDES